MLSIAKCRDLGYYEREVIDGREDYLSEAGSSPGIWVGSLAAADGFSGPAERDDLAAAFSGHHPNGGPLGSHRTAIAGFDLTLSPSKSVSLLWALGTAQDAVHVEAALYSARDQVERYLESTACLVRRGHAGETVEPASGFMGAVFRHRTSRLGDPGIHLHWTVFNVAEGFDGRRTAVDGRALYRERYTAEAIFQATLRHELTVRLGVVFDEIDRHGVAEIVGISAPMRRAFSRRRSEIVAEMERIGSHSGAGARTAALTTRRAKPKAVSEAQLRAEWRQRAGDLRFDLSNVVRVPRAPQLRVTDVELATAVTEQHASFARRDVVRAVAKAARQGAEVEEILSRTDAFLAGNEAIPLDEGRFTTVEILDLERRVVDLAMQPPRSSYRANAGAVAGSLRARPSLSSEQRHMVETLCCAGRPVEVVIGHAGTGKTFTLDAVRAAFEASGHRILGVGLAARAARELQAGSGIPSTTAHGLLNALDTGRFQLRAGDVVVVDEAGMLGTRLMAALALRTATAESKLILVGDPKQLPAVEAGGLLSALASRVEVIELAENRRQRDPEDQAISSALREGRGAHAVRRLDRRGRITTTTDNDSLREQMIEDWLAHRLAGADVVMLAPQRSDVRDLNARAHRALQSADQLGPVLAVVDDRRFCLGDRVLALRNRYDLGITNGDVAEITGADSLGLHARTGEREIHLPLDYVSEHLEHAYARTVHKSQGLTCDVALLLGDDALYAELGYTALTRGRGENHLYSVANMPSDTGDLRLAQVIAALDVSRAKTAAIDTPDVAIRS